MSARTVIVRRAQPGRTAAIRMPSACEARSRSYSACAVRSAMRCASGAGGSVGMGPPRPSAADESRHALRAEGGDPLGIVGGAPELGLVVTLHVELRGEASSPALVDRLLGPRQPRGRRLGEAARQRIDGAGELSVLDAAPDQTPLRGLLG